MIALASGMRACSSRGPPAWPGILFCPFSMSGPKLSTDALPDRALAGIGLMLAAMFAFSLNDVMGKWLVATYGVAQIC